MSRIIQKFYLYKEIFISTFEYTFLSKRKFLFDSSVLRSMNAAIKSSEKRIIILFPLFPNITATHKRMVRVIISISIEIQPRGRLWYHTSRRLQINMYNARTAV